MCIFKKYKDALGKPGKGVHSVRIFNIALFDVFLTFGLAFVIYFALPKKYKINFYYILLITFIIGVISHRLFCVRTKLDTILFP